MNETHACFGAERSVSGLIYPFHKVDHSDQHVMSFFIFVTIQDSRNIYEQILKACFQRAVYRYFYWINQKSEEICRIFELLLNSYNYQSTVD